MKCPFGAEDFYNYLTNNKNGFIEIQLSNILYYERK